MLATSRQLTKVIKFLDSLFTKKGKEHLSKKQCRRVLRAEIRLEVDVKAEFTNDSLNG